MPVTRVFTTGGVRRPILRAFSGGFSAAAVLSTGAVATWGYNLTGALGDGTTTSRTIDPPGTAVNVTIGKAGGKCL